MQIGRLVLAATALCSLMAGVLVPGQKKPGSLPIQLFSQAKPSDFVGDAKCAACHADTAKTFPESPHAIYVHNASLAIDKQGCESCHGPALVHTDEQDPGKQIIAYSKISPKEVIDACLRCHQDLMKRPHFQSESHARAGIACTSCHQIHPKRFDPNPIKGDQGVVQKQVFAATKDSNPLLKADEATLCNTCHQPEVNDFRRNSHHPIPEGRMNCSDCHSIHPTNADKLKKSSLKDRCVTCHQDVAGPFAFEHDPVAGFTGGGCKECHNPHGTNNPKMLTSFSRGLCIQCHTDKGGSNHFAGQTCWTSGCHVAVHGSNHDPRLLTK
jgi:predicted CXXCH cytochrome family protein